MDVKDKLLGSYQQKMQEFEYYKMIFIVIMAVVVSGILIDLIISICIIFYVKKLKKNFPTQS